MRSENAISNSGAHMNKFDLIQSLKDTNGLTNAEALMVVDMFFNAIAEALANGERVELRGLCLFKVKEYQSYTGRNPKTGEQVTVKPKKLPFFKPGADLKERVNN